MVRLHTFKHVGTSYKRALSSYMRELLAEKRLFGAANRLPGRLGNAFHHLETTTYPEYHNPKRVQINKRKPVLAST